jgi:hypothetical protein
MTSTIAKKLSQDGQEILRRALNGHLIPPDTRVTESLIDVLRDHFAKIDLTDDDATCLG